MLFFYFAKALSDLIVASLLVFQGDFAKTENNGREREARIECWYRFGVNKNGKFG